MKAPVIITGRMVLIAILMFFCIIFMVNGAFVYFALDSWPGLSTQKAYEQGRDYNQTISKAETQRALGWSSRINFTTDHDGHDFLVEFADSDSQPLSDLEVHATFSRPVGEENMIELTLPEVSAGIYASPVVLPFSGRWYATIEAVRGEQQSYTMRYEISVDQ